MYLIIKQKEYALSCGRGMRRLKAPSETYTRGSFMYIRRIGETCVEKHIVIDIMEHTGCECTFTLIVPHTYTELSISLYSAVWHKCRQSTRYRSNRSDMFVQCRILTHIDGIIRIDTVSDIGNAAFDHIVTD